MARKKSIHYVNNSDFSTSVVEYVKRVEKARKEETTIPTVPDYVAQCFLRIAEGLSHKANFIRYTYREEMGMDAVENSLKARIKRIGESIVSLIIFIISLPILIVASILIKLEDGGPIIYTQKRNGFEGKVFKIIKK